MKRYRFLVAALLGVSGCSSTAATPAPSSVDPTVAARESCSFTAGATVDQTLGLAAADRQNVKISHVIVMMKENRSFDTMLGRLPQNGRADVDGIPAGFVNPDLQGAMVTPFHATTSCEPYDPAHQWADMHAQYDNGKMDGFVTSAATTATQASIPVTSDGHFALGYYDETDVPFYYWLAQNYALADRYFPSALSGTWANRDYLLLGSSYGVKDTARQFVPKGVRTIFDALDEAKVGWGVYTDEVAPFEFALLGSGWAGAVSKMADFFAGLQAGTLPAVSFIDSRAEKEDEHPPADVHVGEVWTKSVYDAVTQSPLWIDSNGKGVALFFTYDEAGGFFDHVAPPAACVPSPDQGEFDRLGFRVPFVLISPYARRGFLSHVTHEHTSMTRFVEALFDLPALTARDANSDALLDMFDFSAAPLPPATGAPGPGAGTCAATP